MLCLYARNIMVGDVLQLRYVKNFDTTARNLSTGSNSKHFKNANFLKVFLHIHSKKSDSTHKTSLFLASRQRGKKSLFVSSNFMFHMWGKNNFLFFCSPTKYDDIIFHDIAFYVFPRSLHLCFRSREKVLFHFLMHGAPGIPRTINPTSNQHEIVKFMRWQKMREFFPFSPQREFLMLSQHVFTLNIKINLMDETISKFSLKVFSPQHLHRFWFNANFAFEAASTISLFM